MVNFNYARTNLRQQSSYWPGRLLVILPLLLLACQTVTQVFSGDNPAGSHGVNRQDSIYLVGGQPDTLDPATTNSGPAAAVGYIYSGLVALDTDLQVQPDLAAGWDVSLDGLTYTFYLRPDARFHDGQPVTAADVAFSWERAADPETESDTAAVYLGDIRGVPEKMAGEAANISGLEVVDEHTLRVTLDAPKVYFLAKLIMPVAFVVDRRQVAGSDWDRAANGSGPFRLQTWEDDEIVILARNEDYYGGAPDAAHIVYLIGAGIPLSMYENGTTDLVYVGGSDVERMRDPNNPLSAELRTGISFCTTYVGFNTRLPPFDNLDIRRAFVMGLDREQLVATLYQGQGLLANGPIPPGMPGYTGQSGLPYDPAAARALLAQTGLETLPPLTFSTGGYIDAGALVTALITRWQENLGVTISPELIDAFTYIDALYAGDVGHLFTFSWCADYPDPENMVDVLFHSQSTLNIGGFDDPETDALLEQARTETDVDARLALYAAAERRVIEQGAAVFLAHSLDAALVSDRLGGFELTPVSVPQLHRVEIVQER